MDTLDRVVDDFYRAYNAHAAADAVALYAEDGWHDETAMGHRRNGREALRGSLENFFRMLPDVAWTERERIRSAGHVAVLYTMTGHFTPRAKAEGPDQPPRAVSLPGMHLFEIDDGVIRGTRDFWDKASFLQQIA